MHKIVAQTKNTHAQINNVACCLLVGQSMNNAT